MSRGLRAPEKEKDEGLTLFLEMRKREKEVDDMLLQSSEMPDASLGSEQVRSSIGAPTRKNYSEDFLNSENDKNDYDWLLAPSGPPVFCSMETESQRIVMNQAGTSKARPVAPKSKIANTQSEAVAKSNLASSRQSKASPDLISSSSTTALRRDSASTARPATPTRRPTLTSSSILSTLTASKAIPLRTSKPTMTTASSKTSRSSTPTSSRSTALSTTKSTTPARHSSPQSKTTTRTSSTPTRPRPSSLPSSMPPPSRSATPTRGPTTSVASSVKSNSAMAQQPRASSPTVRPRSWNPLEIPGFSHDAPPNLKTALPPARPLSATRGRTGATTNPSRSSSIEPMGNTGRVRRQSCSPSRGRTPNGGVIHGCGSSVPAMSRLHAKANDNVSPVLMGTKMVERIINMRKLAPPRQDDKHSPSYLSGKSSSPDGSGFGRTLSKKSLDMAIRHMDIRRTVPGNLRPLMTNIPASSMYSVRSGHPQSRTASISDSPHVTSSSETSVTNGLCPEGGNEIDNGSSSSRKYNVGSR